MDGLLPFALAILLPLAGAPHGETTLSCNSTCVGKTFKEGPREGEPVCGYELCGKTAPLCAWQALRSTLRHVAKSFSRKRLKAAAGSLRLRP